jgi:hypothetical protein
VFNLTRDQHEINFPHWANHGVAFHYMWTETEAKNKRFLRFSPEYYEEVARLRELGNGESRSVEDLPSYDLWKDDLDGSDWIGQNLRAGKMGVIENRFQPSMRYGIVDRHLYGARPLLNWSTIRVYAERFKALIREGERETVCTFFRNNPLHKDEPAYGRPPLRHQFALTDFAPEEVGEAVPEQARYYESNTVVREQVKNLYAPRPDRPFNSFNGGPALSLPGGSSGARRGRTRGQASRGEPLRARKSPVRSSKSLGRRSSPRPSSTSHYRRSSRSSSASQDLAQTSSEIKGEWARAAAGLRRRSSRSLSPPRRGGKEKQRQARSLSSARSPEIDDNDAWFHEEFLSASSGGSDNSEDEGEKMGMDIVPANRDGSLFGSIIDPVGSWRPKYRTSKEAVADLAEWAPSILEYDPKKPAYDPLSWNNDWLDKAFLVIDDTRTTARLKVLCALFPEELDRIETVLEYALRFGMPFELYTKIQDAGTFRNHQLSSLALNTLPSVYNLGYVDQVMTWAGSSDAAQFGVYMGSIYQLLQKPNAIAFVAKGGICKFVAELFAPDLVYRFVRGPSEQVSEFGKGKTTRLMIDGESTLCISDQVSDVEVAILLGHVKGKNADQERSLWPSQALLEQHSLHVRGYLSASAYTVLEYLSNRILVEKVYDWKTKAEWKAYLRGGSKGEHTPAVVPSKGDFEKGWHILDNSFPVDWQHAAVSKIVLPELFDNHSTRN